MNILIIAADPLVRAGLMALLSEGAGLHLEALAPDDPIETLEADVIIWDLGHLAEIPPFHEIVPPVLILTDDETASGAALAAGAAGALYRDAPPERLAAALAAVTQGLCVLEPAFLFLSSVTNEEWPLEPLTPRELEVLHLLAEGRSNKGIAKALDISENTAKFHVNALLSKFAAGSRTEVVVRAIQAGLVEL